MSDAKVHFFEKNYLKTPVESCHYCLSNTSDSWVLQ